MTKKAPTPPIEDPLLEEIRAYAEGVRIGELAAHHKLSRRTLQRRLAELAAEGAIAFRGQGRSRRYFAARSVSLRGRAAGSSTVRATLTARLAVSSDAAEIERLVGRPIHQRTPVGYDASLLRAYRPNHTRYLPPKTRIRLHEQGRSGDGDAVAGTYARRIFDRLLIDLAWASSQLEGNTYTRLDTQNLIQFGHAAKDKDQREAQMILNHKAAIEMLVSQAEEIGFNRYTFQGLHALLADNLLPDPSSAGRLRRIDVQITGTVYSPLAIPQQIEEHFDLILKKAAAIDDPFEQAFFIMVHIPYLQPFEDVNKRVSRLGANVSLIRANLAPLSFVDVPHQSYVDGVLGIYELGRIELLRDVFVWAYERSCQRYTVIKDGLPQPDPLRLRYRQDLTVIVSKCVRAGLPIDPVAVRRQARRVVDRGDLEAFVSMVINELYNLHEGNLARYGLRPSELKAWQSSRTRPH